MLYRDNVVGIKKILERSCENWGNDRVGDTRDEVVVHLHIMPRYSRQLFQASTVGRLLGRRKESRVSQIPKFPWLCKVTCLSVTKERVKQTHTSIIKPHQSSPAKKRKCISSPSPSFATMFSLQFNSAQPKISPHSDSSSALQSENS
jgi:hypothetical protein